MVAKVAGMHGYVMIVATMIRHYNNCVHDHCLHYDKVPLLHDHCPHYDKELSCSIGILS